MKRRKEITIVVLIFICIGLFLSYVSVQNSENEIDIATEKLRQEAIELEELPISYTQIVSWIGGSLSALYTMVGDANWGNYGTPFYEGALVSWTAGRTMLVSCMEGYHMIECKKIDNNFQSMVYVYSSDDGLCRMENAEIDLARASMQIKCVKNSMTDEEAQAYSVSKMTNLPEFTLEQLRNN